MAAGTALRAEQWESDDAFLASAHCLRSEADRNHSRAVGLYFKELSTAFLDTFCERTEKSLYLAQWLLIKTESYGGGENSTAQALGPLGSHKAKPGRGRQELALWPSLLIRVGLLKTQPCNGEGFPQVLPPSLTPAASTGKRCGGTDATLPPTHPGRAWHCAGHTAGGGDKTRPRLQRRCRQGSGFFASL